MNLIMLSLIHHQKGGLRMRKMKRVFVSLLMVTLVATLFAGCSNSSKNSSNESSQPDSTGKTQSTSDTDKTEVVVWNFTFKTDEQKAEIIKGFDALGKNIKLTFKPLPQGTTEEIDQKLVTNLIGGEKIDIFDGYVSQYYNFTSKGLLEPLDGYIAKDNFDANALGESNIQMSKIDNKLYGLPYIKSKFMLYYNKDLFDKAGVAYPTDDWTWNDFREAAKKLTSGEGSNKIWGFTMPDWPQTWGGMATQTGLKYVNPDNTLNLDKPAFKDALQFKYDLSMVDKSGPSLAENKTTKTHYAKQFSAGNIGMLISGDWSIGQIASNQNNDFKFKYDITNIPHPEGVAKGTTFGAPRYLLMNSKSDQKTKDAAWEVMKYLSSEDVALILAKYAINLPALNTPKVEETFLKNLPDFVGNGKMVLENVPYVEELPMHVASNAINKAMGEEAELALTGTKSIDQAIADMQKRATDEVNKLVKK